jgi:GT2 family glycosyltransferase
MIKGHRELRSLAVNAARHALSDHFMRMRQYEVEVVPARGEHQRVIRPVRRPHPLVSLVMPTGGNLDVLSKGVSGLLNRTDYDSLELIILHNTSTRAEAFPYLEEISADPRVTIVDSRGRFNFSRICNLGVTRAHGDIVGLINDDMDIIESGWLEEMVSHAIRPEVGAVGAMLYYPNDTIQHAGVMLGLGGVNGIAAHIHRGLPRGSSGYFQRAALTQNLSCVTAACMVLRRAVYSEVGGFDENLAFDFNDVDFCISIRRAGYLIVWTPWAELYHLESITRGKRDSPEEERQFAEEEKYIFQKWGTELFDRDPYYNPNLRRDGLHYELGSRPRVAKPWSSPRVNDSSR